MKPINAMPMSPVMIKVIPNPRSGAGMCEYFNRSRMAATATMASAQPTPEPTPKVVASAKVL